MLFRNEYCCILIMFSQIPKIKFYTLRKLNNKMISWLLPFYRKFNMKILQRKTHNICSSIIKSIYTQTYLMLQIILQLCGAVIIRNFVNYDAFCNLSLMIMMLCDVILLFIKSEKIKKETNNASFIKIWQIIR